MDKIETMEKKRVVMVLGQLYFFTPLALKDQALVDTRNMPISEIPIKLIWKALKEMTIGQVLGEHDEKPSTCNIKVIEVMPIPQAGGNN